MIVLNSQQSQWLSNYISNNRTLCPEWATIIPIPIKNNLYILPEGIFDDPKFFNLKQSISGWISSLTIRQVDPSEYITENQIIPNNN